MISENGKANLDLTVTKSDEGLLIEVEEQFSGNSFKKVINKESIKDISQDSFFDLDTISNILQNYKKGKDNESLTLTQEGKLTYSCQVTIGNISKQSGFSIDLEKQTSDPQTKLERSVNKLSLKVSKLEESSLEEKMKITGQLNDFEKRLFDKLQTLESNLNAALEKIKILEKPKFVIQDCSWNPSGNFASKYTLSKNNKVVTALKPEAYCLFAVDPLPADKKCEFSVIIGEPFYVMVGIAPESCLNDKYPHKNNGSIGFCHDGLLHCGTDTETKLGKFLKGDKVTFRVDLNTGKVKILLNGVDIHIRFIKRDYLHEKYYPFIFNFVTVGCGVEFV